MPCLSYAQDTSSLTYQNAVKRAIDNNLSLERTKKNLEDIDKSLTKGFGIDPIMDPTGQNVISAALQYNAAIDNEKATKMAYEAQKEAMNLSIKNSFLNIKYLEKNNKLLDEKISNMAKKLSVNTLKYQHGMMSKNDYDNSKLDMEKLQTSKKENKLKIDMAYKSLANIIGSGDIKKIEYIDVKYETLDSLGISRQSAVGKAISESASIFSQNANIRALEERIKYDLLDTSQTALPRAETTMSVSMKDLNLRTSKKNLENTVVETANNIENLELNIKDLKSQIENLETQAKNISKLVELGFNTKLELENIELKINELKLQEENLMNNHNILVERYKKPYLLSLTGE